MSPQANEHIWLAPQSSLKPSDGIKHHRGGRGRNKNCKNQGWGPNSKKLATLAKPQMTFTTVLCLVPKQKLIAHCAASNKQKDGVFRPRQTCSDPSTQGNQAGAKFLKISK